MSSSNERQLQDAIRLIRQRQTEAGKEILIGLLNEDPTDDRAWVWMSAAVDSDELRRECLEEALKHNPANATAQKMLARLDRRAENSAAAGDPANAPVAPPAMVANTPSPGAPSPTRRGKTTVRQRVIRQLVLMKNRDDIALELAGGNNLNYEQAHHFIAHISQKYHNQILAYRLGLFLGILGIIVVGGLIAWGLFSATSSMVVGTAAGNLFGLLLLLLGVLVTFVSGIWLVFAAFSADALWGVAVLLLPPAWILFLIRRADKAAKPFAVYMVGLVLAALGAWLMGLDAMLLFAE